VFPDYATLPIKKRYPGKKVSRGKGQFAERPTERVTARGGERPRQALTTQKFRVGTHLVIGCHWGRVKTVRNHNKWGMQWGGVNLFQVWGRGKRSHALKTGVKPKGFYLEKKTTRIGRRDKGVSGCKKTKQGIMSHNEKP